MSKLTITKDGGAYNSSRANVPERRSIFEIVNGCNQSGRLTAIIEHEVDVYVALCPELDIASQGARNVVDEIMVDRRQAPATPLSSVLVRPAVAARR